MGQSPQSPVPSTTGGSSGVWHTVGGVALVVLGALSEPQVLSILSSAVGPKAATIIGAVVAAAGTVLATYGIHLGVNSVPPTPPPPSKGP